MGKACNMQEPMSNVSRGIHMPGKNQKESLKIKSIATEMKTVFDRLISKLNMAEERISELEDMTIETAKTENQREKTQHPRTSKACGATTKGVTYI